MQTSSTWPNWVENKCNLLIKVRSNTIPVEVKKTAQYKDNLVSLFCKAQQEGQNMH